MLTEYEIRRMKHGQWVCDSLRGTRTLNLADLVQFVLTNVGKAWINKTVSPLAYIE